MFDFVSRWQKGWGEFLLDSCATEKAFRVVCWQKRVREAFGLHLAIEISIEFKKRKRSPWMF